MAAAEQASTRAHFVLVPLMSQGHIIPNMDLACLLAERGVRVSIVVMPLIAARLQGVTDQAARAGLPLEFVELPFPPPDSGLPPDCQSVDMLADSNQTRRFYEAQRGLAGPLEAYVCALAVRPSCIVSDWCCPWTAGVARNLGIPRLVFAVPSCFFSLCQICAADDGLHERLRSIGDNDQQEMQQYLLPGMPIPVKVTKATAPGIFISPGWEAFRAESMEAMRSADGAVVNTFMDIEGQFVTSYAAALGMPVWALGPLSLANRDAESAAARGESTAVAQQAATMAWLDEKDAGSVLYVSFGSISRKLPGQLFEVGHGLEDSGVPFLWVVKESEVAHKPEVQQWLEALEARTAGRGMVVRGWVPQLAVLSHPAVGGFLTHCGSNSLLEAVVHGVPMVTWPHFCDQFMNEKLAVDVLGVGVPIGVTSPVAIIDDEAVLVVRGDIVRAVSELMADGEEADVIRRKAKEYGEKARRAMEKGGSSYENLTRLIEGFSSN